MKIKENAKKLLGAAGVFALVLSLSVSAFAMTAGLGDGVPRSWSNPDMEEKVYVINAADYDIVASFGLTEEEITSVERGEFYYVDGVLYRWDNPNMPDNVAVIEYAEDAK